jgi:hypothetical protein
VNRQHQRLVDLFAEQRKEMEDSKLAVLDEERRKQFESLYGEPYKDPILSSALDDDGSFGLGPMLGLLRFASIRKEIEVVDEQYERIKRLTTSVLNQYFALNLGELSLEVDSDEHKKGVKRLKAMQDQELQQLEEILLPHQINRLKQLVFQSHVRRQGGGNPLRSPVVVGMLKLTEAEHAMLIAKLDEQVAAYRKETEDLQKDMLRATIEWLTPNQRANYFRLVGKPFDP